MVIEADAVVADAEAQLGRLDVLKALYVAFAGGEIAGQRRAECAGRCPCRWRAGRPWLGRSRRSFLPMLTARCAVRGSSGVRPMRSKSSAVRPNSARTLSSRNAFATGKRGAGGGDLAGFFRADRLIVEGRVGQGAGDTDRA